LKEVYCITQKGETMELKSNNEDVEIRHTEYSPEFISLENFFKLNIPLRYDEELLLISYLQSNKYSVVKINSPYIFSKN